MYAIRSYYDTREYLNHRIATAGGEPGIFTDEAVELIHQYSSGIPRKINQIASLALLEGFGREVRFVGPAILQSIVAELDFLG